MTMQLRILDQIYPFMTNVAISATSEDPEFPASNLAKTFRSKVYRSAGYYEITLGNCTIDFQEALAGPIFSAQIPLGAYSRDGLAAQIKAMLEDRGSETYTVSFNGATGFWTISSAGTYLSLLWQSGPNATTSMAPILGFSALSDLIVGTSHTGTQIVIHSYEAIGFDLGTSSPVDSIAVLFDPSSSIKLSASAELRIQAGPTLNWTSPPYDRVLTIDDDFSAAVLFLAAAQSYRYWRLKVTDPANPNLYVEIPKVLLSSSTQLDRLPDRAFTFNYGDTSKVQRTDYGHEYADLLPIMKQLVITYAALSYSDALLLSKLALRIGITRPVLAVVDPLANTFNATHFMVYGKLAPVMLTGVIGEFTSSGLTIAEANG